MSKVVVRTLTGLSIGLVAGGALWWEHTSGTGQVLLISLIVLGLAAVVELARMYDDKAFIFVGMGALLVSRERLERLQDPTPQSLLLELAIVLGFSVAIAALALVGKRWFAPGRLRYWERPLLASWIAFSLLALLPFNAFFGTLGLLALVLVSKLGDVAGYFVGRAIGKSHPFPSISPGKTTAGCVASLVVGALTGVLVVLGGLVSGSLVAGLCLGAATNLFAQAGDLFESILKRRAGVKDSSTLLGASGGALDVLDSLLFTIPFALLAWPIFLAAA